MSETRFKSVPPGVRDINQVCSEAIGHISDLLMTLDEWRELARDGVGWRHSIIQEGLRTGIDPNGMALRIRFRLEMPGGTLTDWLRQTVKIHKGANGRTVYKLGEYELERETVLRLAAISIARGLKGR